MKPVKKRILVLCPYPYGVAAGQRLKFEQYYDDWRSHGWEVVTSPYMDAALWSVAFESGRLGHKALGVAKGYLRRLRDLFRVHHFDLVYCFMYVTPIGTSLMERLVRTLAPRVVFDLEDNVLLSQSPHPENNPNWLGRLLRGKDKVEFLVRSADHVVTSSPSLNELCREINEAKACTYITASVDADRFVPANRYVNEGPVTIGWTGTFSSRPYLDLLRPVFQQLARERTFRLRVIGNFEYEMPGVDLEVIRWSGEREIEDLQGIDIGVYPLPLDEWVNGKSGLKAIQYMMMGLPCVATDIGTTPLILHHADNGLLVRTNEDWLNALRTLIDEPDLRRRLGQRARLDAAANYSVQAVAKEYRKVLEDVLEKPE